ncbi:hypothetical protein Skr01_29430 [Sphaerisporangium krabiense]|uniref:Chaplin domain-containing protein n=1 Tax=Sphaerisporangium krabiense TaxID=763782 RepID=A0A7W8Z1S4_9ACTN|nr:chaplin family protein [Sphaerisporangium krabiense]MBB5625805.1 hypothetical protein [Sphaerisporangium krabiense]GII62858.1 hypothetical protein Skr01_29430 [Sphaerisporangium krabiense]
MRTWAKGSAPAALLAVAVMALSSGTALADTSGTGSVGGGNQIDLPIKVPVDISGNAAGVIGGASAGSRGGASVQEGGASDAIQGRTDGSHSVLGGNQVNAPITAPISACGNAVSLIGRSDAGCRGGAEVRKGKDAAGGNTTDGSHSVLGGNQVVAPITAPVSVCGNAVAVIGEAAAGCRGGAKAVAGGGRHGAGGNRTDGRGSVIGGNQVVAPITAPVSVCGNAVAVIGHAFAGCRGGATVPKGGNGYGGHGQGGGKGGAGGNATDGRHSVLGGNQIVAPITAPVNVCGNAVGNGAAGCQGGVSVPPAGHGSGAGGNRTSGFGSVLGGNQVVAPITAPVSVCGVSAGVLGRAFSGCRGGATIKGGGGGAGAGNNRTDGRHSVLGGNQVVAPIAVPVSVCGNAVAVLGDAAAGCLGGASVGGRAEGVPQQGPGAWARSSGEVSAAVTEAKPSGLGILPDLPLAPALPGRPKAGETTHQSSQAGGPGEKPLGLPELPVTPGRPAPSGGGPLVPVQRVVSGTPVGGVIGGARSGAGASPVGVGTLGLMSAERPLGVTGMNAGSLVALLTGALCAASAILFAGTRRLRRR